MPSVTNSPICPLFQIPVYTFRISSIIPSVEARRSSHVLILARFWRIESAIFRRQCRRVLNAMLSLLTAAALVISHIDLTGNNPKNMQLFNSWI